MLETLRLTFTANGKLQIFQGNFHTFSTEKLLIHVLILMQSTNCPKFEHQTVQVKIRFEVCRVNLKVPNISCNIYVPQN